MLLLDVIEIQKRANRHGVSFDRQIRRDTYMIAVKLYDTLIIYN